MSAAVVERSSGLTPNPAAGSVPLISMTCPCGDWEMTVRANCNPNLVKTRLRNHRRECVVLAAEAWVALAS